MQRIPPLLQPVTPLVLPNSLRPTPRLRPAWRPVAALTAALLLGGCGPAPAALSGGTPRALPLPPGIRVAFNHRGDSRYRSPVSGQWRQGDDLEALLLESIREARVEILVAVQELSLPAVAEALAERHRRGVRVRVVLENLYSTPWSRQHPVDLPPHQRQRQQQLAALGQGDAVAVLERAGVPLLDDTADGSRGSGLMHHKFLVVDGRTVVTGSANFSPSCIHGDADGPATRGNVNHLLRFDSPALAGLFAAEFARLWGDGPGGRPDSRFGIAKEGGGAQVVDVAGTPVEVLFAPHRRRDPNHGLAWLENRLAGAGRRLDLALFVFSGQNLADRLQQLHARGVKIRLLADPGFANRAFSETLDLLGVTLPDQDCHIEADNRAWSTPLEGVGTPRLAAGDKLHHKFAVIDGREVITGSFNWSPRATRA
jgi:phosphatidylserine/phosphatidylglycerophosphate/cardiolipin synthase-like enzyme